MPSFSAYDGFFAVFSANLMANILCRGDIFNTPCVIVFTTILCCDYMIAFDVLFLNYNNCKFYDRKFTISAKMVFKQLPEHHVYAKGSIRIMCNIL